MLYEFPLRTIQLLLLHCLTQRTDVKDSSFGLHFGEVRERTEAHDCVDTMWILEPCIKQFYVNIDVPYPVLLYSTRLPNIVGSFHGL